MSGIYGKVTEHPEFSIEDERRFTIEVKPHEYEALDRPEPYTILAKRICGRCGFERMHPIHPPLFEFIGGNEEALAMIDRIAKERV